MRANPDVDISSGYMEEFEGNIDNKKTTKTLPLTHAEISDYIKLRNPLNHPAVIFKKSKVESVGGYLHFPLFEDWYLWVRMWKNGAKFANINEPLIHFRVSPEMYKRRGGWKYVKDSAKFQRMLKNNGLISPSQALKASILRGSVYLMPNIIRTWIYINLLRR